MKQDHLLTTEPTSESSQLLREIHVASEYIQLLTIPFIRWHERYTQAEESMRGVWLEQKTPIRYASIASAFLFSSS